MPAPTIGTPTQVGANALVYGFTDIQFTLTTTNTAFSTGNLGDVFDASDVDVWAVVSHPTLPDENIVCFYYGQDITTGAVTSSYEHYTFSGTVKWRLRIPAREAGTANYTIHAIDNRAGGGTATTVTGSRTVDTTAPTLHGVVRPDPRHPLLLRYDDGEPFYPLGNNVGYNDAGTDGEVEWTARFNEISNAGGNWTRKWMLPEEGDALEWSASPLPGGQNLDNGRPNFYNGLGGYNLLAAYRIDRMLALAAARGITVVLSILNMNMGQTVTPSAGKWVNNPYNFAATGLGPVAANNPFRFFDNLTAINLFQRQMRYFIARYGAHSNLIIEWGNELGSFTDGGEGNMYSSGSVSAASTNRTAMANWVTTMGTFIRNGDGGTFTGDPLAHSITWSQENGGNFDATWNSAYIDITQVHRYTLAEDNGRINGSGPTGGGTTGTTPINLVAGLQSRIGKPVFFGEFGLERENSIPTTGDGGSFPEPGLNVTNSANGYQTGWTLHTTATLAHVREATHYRNMVWTMWHHFCGGGYWWWGSGLATSGTARPAGNSDQGFPIQSVVFPAFSAYIAGVDIAALTSPAVLSPTLSSGTKGSAFGNSTNLYAFVRDSLEQFDSGLATNGTVTTARLAGRTTSGKTLTQSGFVPGSYAVEYWGCYAAGGILSSGTIVVPGTGIMTLSLPTFTGAIGIKASLQLGTGGAVWIDDFSRTAQVDTWGTPNTGPAYAYSGTLADFDTTGSIGTVNFPSTASTSRQAGLTLSTKIRDGRVTGRFKIDKLPNVSNNAFVLDLRRSVSGADAYRVRLQAQTTGGLLVISHVERRVANVTTQLGGSQTAVETFLADTWYSFQIEVTGIDPTTINIKVWRSSLSEPSGWTKTVTDSAGSDFETAGDPLMRFELGATNTPVLFSVDDLVMVNLTKTGAATDGISFTESAKRAGAFARTAPTSVGVADAATRQAVLNRFPVTNRN